VVIPNFGPPLTLVGGFEYFVQITFASIDPGVSPELGGVAQTLTGTGFDGGIDEVTFDGVAGTNLVVVNDTTITVDCPAGTVGVVDVEVVPDLGDAAALVGGFEYFLDCTVTDCDPNTGDIAGGTAVTITGTGFDIGVGVVLFNSEAAADLVVVNDTTITCDTPAHDPGAVNVTVEVNVGAAGVLTDGFTYTSE
jgi:large repetitive protein